MSPLTFDQDLGFPQRVEDLTVQQFVSEFTIDTTRLFPRSKWTNSLFLILGKSASTH